MKKIERKKLITRGRLAAILVGFFALSLAASIILYFTVWGKSGEEEPKEPPIAQDGEAVVNGSLMAYPTMQESKIQYISVKNEKGSFGMVRPDKEGNFVLYYVDENGNEKIYRPNVADADDDFEYSALYSIETEDGYGMVTKLKYLCMALMYPYVEERIDLIPEEREAQLDAYGLAEGEYETVEFVYLDEDGNEKRHTVKIGDATTLGTGYYIWVDNRDCIYASYQNQLDYALLGFYSFIKPIVISPGIDEDSVIGAYLTTNYYQWKNETHDKLGDKTTDDSRVIALVDVIVPVEKKDKEANATGYDKSGYGSLEFDLSKYKGKIGYERMLAALKDKAVGSYSSNEIVFTLVGKGDTIDFSLNSSLMYEYIITEIEALLTDSGEITSVGTPVGDYNLIKVAYSLKIDGASASDNVLHSVIDLTNPAFSPDFVEALRAKAIGKLSVPLSFAIDYTKENADKNNVKYVITELVSVFDKNGVATEKVTSTSIVTYRYRFEVNGVLEEKEYLATLDLGQDTSETGAFIKEKLKGRSASREQLKITVDEYTEHCEIFSDFITYSVSEIKYFVTREMVSAFRFLNKSNRDPFYGESIYENTLENEYKIYGLNNSVCQKVVNILTGISEDTTSAPSGLIGYETIDIGLTPEKMEKYGLYAYTIYFELPRGIYTIESGYDDVVDDYAWYKVLGFTLYISEETEDGARYVASDLYDIVTKMDAENFVFLKYNFVNFFARRELMLTEVTYMQAASFELNFDDIKGAYDMDLIHTDIYVGTDNKGYTSEDKMPQGVGTQSVFDEIIVKVTPRGECTANKLVDYVATLPSQSGFVSLTELYGGSGNRLGYDSAGTSNFKKLLESIYFTGYSGIVEPEEQDTILSECKMLFRMSYKLESNPKRYVYEFYRYSEGAVLVKLYLANYDSSTGEYTGAASDVSDFYISNFAFRKMVNNFVSLLNVEIIDKEAGYPD